MNEFNNIVKEATQLSGMAGRFPDFDLQGKQMYLDKMQEMSDRYEVFIKRLELSQDPAAKEYLRTTNAQMLEGGFTLNQMFAGLKQSVTEYRKWVEQEERVSGDPVAHQEFLKYFREMWGASVLGRLDLSYLVKTTDPQVILKAQNDPQFWVMLKEISTSPSPAAMTKWMDHPTLGPLVAELWKSAQKGRHANQQQDGQGSDLLDRRSTLENGVFGVLFTLSKENSETRIRIRWVLLKILLDGWQLFATVIQPAKQGWDINPDGAAWSVVSVLNFTWLADLSYSAYLALLYSAVALLVVNIGLCVWVAWCFKEQKFPVVWPIKVLRVFSSIFFQAFDVASLNLLQLGFSCRFTGPVTPHMHMDLFPAYSCASSPHVVHAVTSGIFLLLFVVIALLLNMAEVEVNPLSRRPLALGHSGAEVMAFAIKALLTLVDVFLGWRKVAACAYLALSLALAWQYLRWNPNLVAWVNYLKAGVSGSIVWCCATLMLLVFAPGVKSSEQSSWSSAMTITMLAGLAPAFGVGAAMSWFAIRKMTHTALQAMADAKPDQPLQDICDNLDDPRDVEIVARSARVWRDRYTLDPDAVQKAHNIIKAGLAMFPGSAYMVLLHADFMIDVLGVSQSGARRIEDARKLSPSLMCRFMMFVRQQQATQKAAGSHANDGVSMDLLGYVEYQRKQRMVVRLHREALQAMCNFWKALDASRVSFTHLSKALGKIESSVSQAQAAYRVVLESYGTNPKLIRLYGKFLEKIKNDPWGAAEYFAEADRLEEVKNGDARGPLLPDGTPLGRMDEMAAAVLVINATGEIQMANKQTHNLFGHKRGTLEAKPLAMLLAPHCARRVSEELARMVANSSVTALMNGGRTESGRSTDGSVMSDGPDLVVVGMHVDRVAFSVKLSIRKASGVGEDSTFIALLEPAPPVPNMAKVWVSPNGIVAAADPQFVAHFGWKATEVNGSNLTALMMVQSTESVVMCGGQGEDEEVAIPKTTTESATETVKRLLRLAKVNSDTVGNKPVQGLHCLVAHKYDSQPVPCNVTVVETTSAEISVHELRLQLASDDPAQLLVVNRKGSILHASTELASALKDSAAAGTAGGGPRFGGVTGQISSRIAGAGGLSGGGGGFVFGADLLTGFTLCDFLPAPWKDMHVRFLKDITSSSPPTRSLWSCRKAAAQPTLELRSMTGRPLYMHVSITTGDLNGESTHVISLQRSSLEAALSERRVRLTVSEDGLVSAASRGLALQMLGLEPGRVIGRGLWEVVSEEPADTPGKAAVRASTPAGPHLLGALIERALANPGASWRVDVSNPLPRKSGGGPALALARQQSAMVRAKAAVMQVHVEPPSDEEAAAGQGNRVYVDLWPLHAVSGVLQLDAAGRITSVLEEHTRPAGLLFGLHHDALVGEALSSLVTMPPGRTTAAELLSLHGAKKSNLKTKQKDVAVKVGPVHKLRATHTDGKPLVLDVQVVGKPGPNEPLIAILRLHAAPMLPAAAAVAPAAAPPPARAVDGVANKGGTAAAETAAAAGVAVVAALNRKPSLDDLLEKVEAAEVAAAAGKVAAGARNSKESFSVGQVHTPPTGGSLRRGDSTVVKAIGTDAAAAVAAAAAAAVAAASGSMEDAGAAPLPLPMPANLLAGMSNSSLPVPGVTAAAAAATGRNKLADLVRSVGGEQQAAGSGKMVLGSGDGSLPPAPRTRPGASRRSNNGDGGSVVAAELPHAVLPETTGVDVQSVDGDDREEDQDSEGGGGGGGQGGKGKGADRILSWVASKGAYYQNSVAAKTDDEGSVKALSEDACSDIHAGNSDMTGAAYAASERTERTAATVTTMATAQTLAGLKSATAAPDVPYADDDAASEGGQSAMSAQSASGAEYKRGKRFRKLVKLMDSGQAQQVQKRFKLHALITVGILAAVHVVCFVLTVVSIGQQRASMLQLGRSAELQLSLHQILADVRSLDVIVQNKSLPTLYTASDSSMFLSRISVNAEKIKDRLNEILQNHHDSDSPVMALFYFTTIRVWNGRDQNGSDVFTNTTIWDFGTRIYSMTKLVEQSGAQWLADGRSFVDQDPGQFLIKSGPDFFRASRRILDALLYTAVDSAKKVNTLQLVFLAVEGAAISCAAACYLAYLLRAVAAQRYKLYGTFLVIPVGLTRALASQNTTLLVDEDEDEDEDDEEGDRTAMAQANNDGSDGENEDGAGKQAAKQKRTLGFSASAVTPSADTPGGGGSKGAGGAGPRKKVAPWDAAQREGTRVPAGAVRASDVLLGGDDDDGASGLIAQQRTYTGSFNSSRSRGGFGGCWGWARRLVFRSRSLGTVAPLPTTRLGSILGPRGWAPSTQQAVAQQPPGASSSSKRTLKYDSNDTSVMLTPFVMWSVLVIAFYATAVVEMRDIVDTVAVHSVVNFMNARTSRNVFLSQELAVVEDPAQVPAKQLALQAGVKLVRDAFYTLQLGNRAYLTAGNATERYPLVTTGLSHASARLEDLFYGSGSCHRLFPEYLPCPGPEYRYYEISHTGFDTMMQQFLISLEAMAFNATGLPQGLGNKNFDYIYNVGYKDMIGAILQIKQEHYNIIVALFDRIMLLHIILFLLLWVIFAGFLFILLNPLIKRVSKERRRIAELMSQLPLELDVEKLVGRALGTGQQPPQGPGGVVSSGHSHTAAAGGGVAGAAPPGGGADATSKWKAIIKQASTNFKAGGKRASTDQLGNLA
ncbi:hypothetical protein HYH02_011919 [Chlamydomonas schloesseri]|uniref:PAS domain-containing protein n=1 Tax=Chlamydomonas schloesseri TaxID=2026947 RepID=A0A835W314_9CHLO|nr:hypothetical protein HYH02_011919 [Chlamydomonas schloesseri]|eukprot:KAG2435418.1 hypothetical protein HYH02_011919 [Chlamydomonas schloesseri]